MDGNTIYFIFGFFSCLLFFCLFELTLFLDDILCKKMVRHREKVKQKAIEEYKKEIAENEIKRNK